MRKSVEQRFYERYIPEPNSGCWIWTAGVTCKQTQHSYGTFTIDHLDKKILAHRLSYFLNIGPIPEGTEIDHKCRVTLCVNPKHLEAVTHKENVLRGIGKAAFNARMTDCKNGHALTGNNLYISPKGKRRCKRCSLMTNRKWYARKVTSRPTIGK